MAHIGIFICLVLVVRSCCFGESPPEEKPPCKSNAHVCTSIMKYPDGSVFNEGPYCLCPGCSSKWQADDFMSMSWPHYERADKTVQYRFCVPIIPKRLCDHGDLAVTIATAVGEWNPHVRDARCACPNNMYQLIGWWRHPSMKAYNSSNQWIYEYFCEKPTCIEEQTPCAKIYINKQEDGKDSVIGYNFMCGCPHGYKCPDRDDDVQEVVETDDRGTYIPKFCQVIHRSFKK